MKPSEAEISHSAKIFTFLKDFPRDLEALPTLTLSFFLAYSGFSPNNISNSWKSCCDNSYSSNASIFLLKLLTEKTQGKNSTRKICQVTTKFASKQTPHNLTFCFGDWKCREKVALMETNTSRQKNSRLNQVHDAGKNSQFIDSTKTHNWVIFN